MTGDQVRLPEGPASARQARAEVRRRLEGCAPDDVDTVVLLVSELVTNAVLHAGGPVCLRLALAGRCVRAEVRDTSTRLPQRRRALDRERTSGRGTHLVEALAVRNGAELEATGKVVWCEVELSR